MLRYGTSPLAQHLLSTNGLGCLIDIGKTAVQDFAHKKRLASLRAFFVVS